MKLKDKVDDTGMLRNARVRRGAHNERQICSKRSPPIFFTADIEVLRHGQQDDEGDSWQDGKMGRLILVP